jgi:hypothetical protein
MTFPLNVFRVSIMFNLGNNDPKQRDLAIAKVEEVAQVIAHPNNRADETRIVHFDGARTELFKDSGFWAVADITFSAEYILIYPY